MAVIPGDISRVASDALITAINSGGAWFGGIDGVIMRAAGSLFHDQAGRAMPLRDGQTVVANGGGANRAAFKNVVFVVDDLRRPLSDVVLAGLQAASDKGFTSVSLPTIRMGVMLGVVEKSAREAVAQMADGVKRFLAANPATPIQTITFVVYNDSATQSLLASALG